MKIIKVDDETILFNNGSKITFDHDACCYEYNYADFSQLEELAMSCEFPEELVFETAYEYGFRFGGAGTPMFFIPCYSDQNGCYSSEVDIYYNDKKVLEVEGEIQQ